MNHSRQFTFTASPTLFHSEDCTVSGLFEWEFDPVAQKLGERRATVTNINPERIFEGPGVPRYHFTTAALDLSLTRVYEGMWPQGHGYRDTLRLQVTLYVTFLDSSGHQQVKALHTEECLVAGTRYYEP